MGPFLLDSSQLVQLAMGSSHYQNAGLTTGSECPVLNLASVSCVQAENRFERYSDITRRACHSLSNHINISVLI